MQLKKLLLSLLFFNAIVINGQSWTQLNSPTTSYISSCCFLNENLGWIVTGNGIYKTTNGGTSWVSQSFPAQPDHDTRFFNSVHFINQNVGIIACGNYLGTGNDPNLVSTILWTNDGGQNWVYKDLGSYNDYDSNAILVTPLIAYSIGQYGQSKRTVDGGNTWTDLNFSGIGYSGRKIFAIDQYNVYFAGLQNLSLVGAIGRINTSTWMITDFPGTIMMQGIFFANAASGCIVGNDGVVKVTTDGGNTWVDGNSGTTSIITSVSFKDTLHGWASTYDGGILKTVDGGYTWTTEYSGTTSMNEITFSNLNGFGYAVGAGGKILKYNSNLQTGTFEKNDFFVYPNPTNGIFKINMPSSIENARFEIYAVNGIKISEGNVGAEETVDASSFSSGVYIVKISVDGTSQYLKVVKD